jgi:aldehyde:ferredoxin oxidoreductase
MKIWRINLNAQSLALEDVPPAWSHLGGRGLSCRILLDEGVATCEPLGLGNKLVYAPGLLVGHMLSSCDRISVGAKSPLTFGIKESNAGGSTGMSMALLGMKALIVEGKMEEGLWILHLSMSGIRFIRVDEMKNWGVTETARKLLEIFPGRISISLIGAGGEMKLAAAGIQNLDKDRVPSRIAARGGLGAVMGSKGIKAIIFDASGGEKPGLFDAEAFKAAQKRFTKALLEHPQIKVYADYGTAAIARMSQGFGALPTRNFSSGHFDGLDSISGEHLRETILERGGDGETTHACMAGCTIRCSNIFADNQGKSVVSPLEYETIGLMGSNLGIDNLDTIAQMNSIVNDLGLDSIEIGAALGVAAEAGLMKFGDGAGAIKLLHEIRLGSPLGRIIGNGAAMTGRVFGVERVPVVKNQAISAYEPRAIKGTGVTYATSPQGADHTCGLTIRAKVDHLDPTGQAELSRNVQINNAGYDTLGACIFAGFGFSSVPEAVRDLINARYGWNMGLDALQILGRETIKLEREFNRLAGFTSAHDRLPEYMRREVLPPFNPVFDVPESDLDRIWD